MAEGNFVLTRIDQTLVVTLKGVTAEAGAFSAARHDSGDSCAAGRRQRGVRGFRMRGDRHRRVWEIAEAHRHDGVARIALRYRWTKAWHRRLSCIGGHFGRIASHFT